MNNYLRALYIVVVVSLLTVILTRLMAPAFIEDYNNYSDLGALALLTLVFFFTFGIINTIITPIIFYFSTDLGKTREINFIYLFLICLSSSTAVIFLSDWLYDFLIESNTSRYYANLLIYSLEESGDTDEELFEMLKTFPFLAQNYIVNLFGILLSWVVCIPSLRYFLKLKKPNNYETA
jgi:hypothetical protein